MSTKTFKELVEFLYSKKKAKLIVKLGNAGGISCIDAAGLCVCCGRYIKHVDLYGRGHIIVNSTERFKGDAWMICDNDACGGKFSIQYDSLDLWECDNCNFHLQIGTSCFRCGEPA